MARLTLNLDVTTGRHHAAAEIDDTQHGDRGGGSLHSVATTSVAGFMSAADKTLLDGLGPLAVSPQWWVFHGGAGDAPAGSVRYFAPGVTSLFAASSPAIYDAPFAMRIGMLQVRTGASQASDDSATITLWVDVGSGFGSAATYITIGTGAAAGVFQSSGVNIDLAAGDRFYWKLTNNSTGEPSATILTGGFLVTPL